MRYPDEITVGAYKFRRVTMEGRPRSIFWEEVLVRPQEEPEKMYLEKNRRGWLISGPFSFPTLPWWPCSNPQPTPEKALTAYINHSRKMAKKDFDALDESYKKALANARGKGSAKD